MSGQEKGYTLERSESQQNLLFRSRSGASTPIPIPDLYTQRPNRYPGLDTTQNSTGVIWSTEQATDKGYHPDDPSKYLYDIYYMNS